MLYLISIVLYDAKLILNIAMPNLFQKERSLCTFLLQNLPSRAIQRRKEYIKGFGGEDSRTETTWKT